MRFWLLSTKITLNFQWFHVSYAPRKICAEKTTHSIEQTQLLKENMELIYIYSVSKRSDFQFIHHEESIECQSSTLELRETKLIRSGWFSYVRIFVLWDNIYPMNDYWVIANGRAACTAVISNTTRTQQSMHVMLQSAFLADSYLGGIFDFRLCILIFLCFRNFFKARFVFLIFRIIEFS